MGSAQSENLRSLKITLHIPRTLRLHFNLEIAQPNIITRAQSMNFELCLTVSGLLCSLQDERHPWYMYVVSASIGNILRSGRMSNDFEMFCAKQYGVHVILVHLHDILQLYSCIYLCYYVFACILCASHRARGKFNQMKWWSTIETMPCCPPLSPSWVSK